MTFYSALVVCLALVASAFTFESCHAFSLGLPRATTQTCSFPTTTMTVRPTISALRAADEGSSEAEESVAEAVEEGEAAEEEPQEDEGEKEDPDVKALKDEIVELEKTLKAKKSQIQYLKDSNETYSKAGYARKVAEMENMRRARSVSHIFGQRKGYSADRIVLYCVMEQSSGAQCCLGDWLDFWLAFLCVI